MSSVVLAWQFMEVHDSFDYITVECYDFNDFHDYHMDVLDFNDFHDSCSEFQDFHDFLISHEVLRFS